MPLPVGTGTIVFNEPFTYSDGALTSVASGVWSQGLYTGQTTFNVSGNKLVHGGGDGNWKDNYTVSAAHGDGDYECLVSGAIADTRQFFFFTNAHHQGESPNSGTGPSGYVIRVGKQAGLDRVRLQRWVNGAATVTWYDLNFELTLPFRFLIRVISGTVEGFYDNGNTGTWTSMGTAQTDASPLGAGRIGLLSEANGINIDNVYKRLTEAASVTVNPPGRASTAAIGTQTTKLNVAPPGRGSLAALGNLSLSSDLFTSRYMGFSPYLFWRGNEHRAGGSYTLLDVSANARNLAIGTKATEGVEDFPFTPGGKAAVVSPGAAPLGTKTGLTGLPTNMTAVVWVKLRNLVNFHVPLQHNWGTAAAGTSGWTFVLTASGEVVFGLWPNGGSIVDAEIVRNLADDQWHMLAGKYDGTTITLYIDGAQVATQTAVGLTVDPVGSVLFGDGASTSDYSIGSAAIFPSALSGANINTLAQFPVSFGFDFGDPLAFDAEFGGIDAPMVPVIEDEDIRFTAEVAIPEFEQEQFAWEELYESLEPFHYAEEQYDYPLRKFCQSLLDPAEIIYWLVRDQPNGDVGWSILLDPTRCPDQLIPWLQQLAGIRPIRGNPAKIERKRILTGEGYNRGTLRSIYEAAATIGAATFAVTERYNDSPWQIQLLFTPAEYSPEAEQYVAGFIPAGIKYTVSFWGGKTYQMVKDQYSSYSEVSVNFPTYQDLRGV